VGIGDDHATILDITATKNGWQLVLHFVQVLVEVQAAFHKWPIASFCNGSVVKRVTDSLLKIGLHGASPLDLSTVGRRLLPLTRLIMKLAHGFPVGTECQGVQGPVFWSNKALAHV
jgi:hypothetical protein